MYLDRIDARNGCTQFAPIEVDLPLENPRLSWLMDKWRGDIHEARSAGLPVVNKPLDQARRGFFEGVIDTIIGRVRSLSLLPADLLVTVITSPSGERVLYAKGYYFRNTVFGNTDCTKPLKAGTYSFYKRSDIPYIGMELHDIVKDDEIQL